jgi:hypothetical protein
MDLANLLLGFFITHAGRDAGAADERAALSVVASACTFVGAMAWRSMQKKARTFRIPFLASLATAAEKSPCLGSWALPSLARKTDFR